MRIARQYKYHMSTISFMLHVYVLLCDGQYCCALVNEFVTDFVARYQPSNTRHNW